MFVSLVSVAPALVPDGEMIQRVAVSSEAVKYSEHAERTNRFYFASFAPLRESVVLAPNFSQLLMVAASMRCPLPVKRKLRGLRGLAPWRSMRQRLMRA